MRRVRSACDCDDDCKEPPVDDTNEPDASEGFLAGAFGLLTADRLAQGAQAVMTARRYSKKVAAEAGGFSRTAWAVSSDTLCAVNDKLEITKKVSETVCAADARFGISAQASSMDEKYQWRERATNLIQEWKEEATRGAETLNKEVTRRICSMGNPRELISALDRSALCYFDVERYPGARGLVALTIDDAPCHQRESENCMLSDVCKLLADHAATATFFLCTDYVQWHGDAVVDALLAGHDIANHGGADRSYGLESEANFEKMFVEWERICDGLRRRAGCITNFQSEWPDVSVASSPEQGDANPQDKEFVAVPNSNATETGGGQESKPIPRPEAGVQNASGVDGWICPRTPRWFRAPHADASPGMYKVLRKYGFNNVLCDSFANDTVIADPEFIATTLFSMISLEGGSIVVIHIPEKGFREYNLDALKLLLQKIKEAELRVTSLTNLAEAANKPL